MREKLFGKYISKKKYVLIDNGGNEKYLIEEGVPFSINGSKEYMPLVFGDKIYLSDGKTYKLQDMYKLPHKRWLLFSTNKAEEKHGLYHIWRRPNNVLESTLNDIHQSRNYTKVISINIPVRTYGDYNFVTDGKVEEKDNSQYTLISNATFLIEYKRNHIENITITDDCNMDLMSEIIYSRFNKDSLIELSYKYKTFIKQKS